MNISHKDVGYALVDALLTNGQSAVVLNDSVVKIVYENDTYEPQNDVPYIVCRWEPGSIESTIDVQTYEELDGEMTIECNVPAGMGAFQLNSLADLVMARYPEGKELTRGDWQVTPMYFERENLEKTEQWRRFNMIIHYYAVR